jgi:hypothetical protein
MCHVDYLRVCRLLVRQVREFGKEQVQQGKEQRCQEPQRVNVVNFLD